MKLNITQMGDGYVCTLDDETQEVFHKDELGKLQQSIGSLIMAQMCYDSQVVQLEIEVEIEQFTKDDATPVPPR